MKNITITRELITADLPEIPEEQLSEIRRQIAARLDADFLRAMGVTGKQPETTFYWPPKPEPSPRTFLGVFSDPSTWT